VEDAAGLLGLRFGRSVDDERAHGDDAALGSEAIHRRDFCAEIVELFVGEDAKRVSAGQNAKGAVVRAGVVKMKAKREHCLQSTSRGVGIVHTILDGPGSPAGRVVALAQWESGVLVPNDQPIGVRRFIE